MHEHVPSCGKNPVCLTMCSRSSAVCLSLHSDKHEALLAFLALWSLWDWNKQLPRQPAEVSGAATPGFLGPLPFVHWGPPTVFGEFSFPCVRAVKPTFKLGGMGGLGTQQTALLWQLERILFGLPAREL